MTRPRLLDLFCGEGGAGMGYHRAGFEVVGVDLVAQPRYPFEFWQMDALDAWPMFADFDAVHASPPCQGYSRMRHLPWLKDREYPMLIEPVRKMLVASGKPYVIENVAGAPLDPAFMLCGLDFGLRMYRHRMFESNVLMLSPPHQQHREVIGSGRMLGSRYSRASAGVTGLLPDPAGHPAGASTKAAAAVMGVEWMTRDGMTQAIPPAYCQFIGEQLMNVLLPVAAHHFDGSLPERTPDISASPGHRTDSRRSTDGPGGNEFSAHLLPSKYAATGECSPELSRVQDATD
jgi:DNA (cytosine-5)-methyltransferase 1